MSACTSTSYQEGDVLADIIVPTPSNINIKYEVVLTRLNDIIQRADVSDEQRAELYYERGLKYDSVGLRYMARVDFNQALRLKPNFADAYNFLGIHFTQVKEFQYAYDAFDSAIDIAPEHEYAYFNRGIALYYGERPKLALEDLSYFYNKKRDDVFRILWLYITEVKIDETQAFINLTERSQHVSDVVWVKNLLDLYKGTINQKQFLALLPQGLKDDKALTERLCEAYFYLGKYNLMKGFNKDAASFFKLALSTNVYEYVEHRYAKLELDLMNVKKAIDVTGSPLSSNFMY